MRFSKGITVNRESIKNIEVWFDGEDLDDDPQFQIELRDIGGEKMFPIYAPHNLSDGVSDEDLQAVMKIGRQFAVQGNKFLSGSHKHIVSGLKNVSVWKQKQL